MSHFYTTDGKPCHYQPDGKDTTLRHARKQNLVPSVTDILGIIDKPGLTKYLINQHLQAAWETDDGPVDNYAEWCKEIRQKASEHSSNARDKGIAVHDAIEKGYQAKEIPDEYLTTAHAVMTALSNVYGIEVGKATPEVTFARGGYGGTVDLVSDEVIIDFKTKADGWELKRDGTPKKMWYVESHAAQLAAYRFGLEANDKKCANVFISPDDEVYIHEWSEEDLRRGMEIFIHSLNLWKAVKDF